MKKLFSVIVIFLLSFCSFAISLAEPWRVFDSADLLNQTETEELENRILEFQRDTNMDFVVLSTDDYLGENGFNFACFFWDNGAFGFGSDARGVIYYIDMHSCHHYIVTSGKAIELISNDKIDTMIEMASPFLTDGNYYTAVFKVLEETEELILER